MFDQNCYISSASNAIPHAVHWGNNNLICYASCNAVLIFNPTIGGGKVIKTLCKHTKKINVVKWIGEVDYETEIVSCSVDGNVVVWTYNDESYIPTVLEGHTGTVNAVDALYKDIDSRSVVVVSTSIDSTLRVWYRQNLNSSFESAQEINLGYNLCITVKLAVLQCGTLLLACAIDNNDVDFYVEGNENNIQFTRGYAPLSEHSDWVCDIDFRKDGDKLFFATCSQDNSIRLHEITTDTSKNIHGFQTTKQYYKIHVQSVLRGHEGWVYSVNWSRKDLKKLLSASIDKTVIIWEYDNVADLWLESARLGEVGGNTLGFYGAMFSPDGKTILAHSYHGAFHVWNYVSDLNIWDSTVTVGGHFGEVVDLGWEPKGEFLITASFDQTTRVHAPWKISDESETTWHEIARPQVHGYDLSCLTILSRYKYASGAEEKIIRAFQAPMNFVENFKRICFIENDDNESEFLPKGAAVPSLGLSNKAVFDDNNEDDAKPKDHKNPYPEESHFTAIDLYNPPTEETLIQNTLWPEIQKLYGHGYEVYSLASTADGSLLASSCKSASKEHAAILLWETSSWQQLQKLISHTLTVVQMAFSPDGNHLLSVSRDRRWSLFTKTPENKFQIVATTDKKTGIHTRIIWCCGWSHDSKYFVTGSRDGKVVVWWKNEKKVVENVLGMYEAASECLDIKGSVTALAFAPTLINGAYIISIGMESGEIYIYKWMNQWDKVLYYDNSIAHHLTVKRLAFRPVLGCARCNKSENILQLASCSSDHSVRIYNIETLAL